MTDVSKTRTPEKQVENLELNKETLQDLTEQEADQVRGGLVPRHPRCTDEETGCF